MPMVPGLSTNMPSRISFDDDPISGLFEDNYVPLDLDNEFLHALSASDILGPLSTLSDDEMFSAGSLFPAHEVKRECLFGKPDELCLRECGQECDPFNRYCEVRRCGCGSTMAITHYCDHYKMVNPQSVLPVELPRHSVYSDHSYYQTATFPDYEPKQTNSYESESQSDSADEIVDVETVQVEPPVSRVVKKRGRKPAQKLKPKTGPMNRRTIVKKRNIQQGRPKCQKWGKASREPSSASSSDAEECGKRSNHNNMERQRRDEQKFMLETLRLMIPDVRHKPKAAKVTVLKAATVYVNVLTADYVKKKRKKFLHAEKKKELEKRLSQLQKQLKLQ